MEHPQSTELEPNGTADIAAKLGCLTALQVAVLADVKPSTLDAWRKRGKGPPYLRFGNNFLYPNKTTSDYLQTLVRERSVAPKGVL